MTQMLLKRRKDRLDLKKDNEDLTTAKPAFTTYRNSSNNSQPFVDSEKSPSSQKSRTQQDPNVNDRILWAKFEKEWTAVSSDVLKAKKHNFLQVTQTESTVGLDQLSSLLAGFRFLKSAEKLAKLDKKSKKRGNKEVWQIEGKEAKGQLPSQL